MATAQERHPHAYTATNEDPRKRRRIVPMEVLSCGYSRTGTMTMKAAFETLGIPTWHFVEMAANPPDMDMWSDALLRKFTNGSPYTRKEFDMLLGNWGGVTDQPAAVLCEELIEAYPEAKVVLVERDVDKWYKSFSDTVIDGSFNPWIPLARWIDPVFMKRVCYQSDLLMRYYFGVSEPRAKGLFNNSKARDAYRANAKRTYLEHSQMVKRVVPKDRLLLFRWEDGWAPLCEFLGKPIPDVPFPWVNETLAVQEKIRIYIGQSCKRALTRFVTSAAPVLALLMLASLSYWWK